MGEKYQSIPSGCQRTLERLENSKIYEKFLGENGREI